MKIITELSEDDQQTFIDLQTDRFPVGENNTLTEKGIKKVKTEAFSLQSAD